jgi:hypothetical protein
MMEARLVELGRFLAMKYHLSEPGFSGFRFIVTGAVKLPKSPGSDSGNLLQRRILSSESPIGLVKPIAAVALLRRQCREWQSGPLNGGIIRRRRGVRNRRLPSARTTARDSMSHPR